MKDRKGERNHQTQDTKIMTAVTYLYLVLPFLIFAIGWFRIRFFVPISIAVLYCTWKAWKDTPAFWRPAFTREQVVKILFIFSVLAIWVYYSGIGRHVFQNSDHTARNSIFEILVEYDWPVYNRDVNWEVYPQGTSLTSLIYYIGFWMPSALVGKLGGLDAGYWFQMVWAFLGVVIVYYFICARKRKLLVWPLLLLMFFSGLDLFGMYLSGVDLLSLDGTAHLEWWMRPYQYSSMTTQLFWVFNQALPAWVCTAFMMQLTNNRSLVFLISTVMLHSTFPFVGLLALMLFWMFRRKYEKMEHGSQKEKAIHWLQAFFKDTCTIQNILGGGVIGIFSYVYLHGNTAASRIASQGFFDLIAHINGPRYLVFFLAEAGIYLLLIYKYKKNSGIYYAVLFSLVLIPLLKGGANDFCMRVSIPALFVLMLLIEDVLEEAKAKRDWKVLCALMIALCIGSVTPFHEIARTVRNTVARQNSGESFGDSLPNYDILNSIYFSGSVEDNLFFSVFAKRP